MPYVGHLDISRLWRHIRHHRNATMSIIITLLIIPNAWSGVRNRRHRNISQQLNYTKASAFIKKNYIENLCC